MRSDDKEDRRPHLRKFHARRIGLKYAVAAFWALSSFPTGVLRQVKSNSNGGDSRRASGSMKRLLFVDDHPIYRDGIRRTLEAGIPDLSVSVAADATARWAR